MSASNSARPGWYPDPSGQQGVERFWNGAAWTAQVRTSRSAKPANSVPDAASPGADHAKLWLASGLPSAGPGEIIPPRPLRLEDIIAGAARLMKAQPGWLIGFPAAVSAVMTLLWFGATAALGIRIISSIDVSAGSFFSLIVLLFLLIFAIELAAFAVIATAVVVVSAPAIRGKAIATRSTRDTIIASAPRLAGFMVVYGVLTLAPYVVGGVVLVTVPILLLFVPVGWAFTVWLVVRYSLAIPIILLEGATTLNAMRRSDQLIQGSWWRSLGIQVVALALMWCAFIVGYAVTFGLGLFLIGAGWAFYVAVVLLLYYDLTLRREGATPVLTREGSDD
ncbi:DUF2510 domain-containing protein [Hoyosella subflava]|uniref:DUF2510 domain-containing protein n=1 Tax=Hoyosella subflava TaxID=639313 RepID=UPI0013051224|nr:DUF2510 domain-containing protein [Hoyosella subflava]